MKKRTVQDIMNEPLPEVPRLSWQDQLAYDYLQEEPFVLHVENPDTPGVSYAGEMFSFRDDAEYLVMISTGYSLGRHDYPYSVAMACSLPRDTEEGDYVCEMNEVVRFTRSGVAQIIGHVHTVWCNAVPVYEYEEIETTGDEATWCYLEQATIPEDDNLRLELSSPALSPRYAGRLLFEGIGYTYRR